MQGRMSLTQLASFLFPILNFLSLGLYARHLRVNYATLIFCAADMAGEKILFTANPGLQIHFLKGRQGQERPIFQGNPMRPDAQALLCVSAGAIVGG